MGLLDSIIPGLGLVTGLLGMNSSAKAANNANNLSQQQLQLQNDWMNRQWQYQQPFAENSVGLLQQMRPLQNQTLAQLYALQGMTPGSTIPGQTPITDTPIGMNTQQPQGPTAQQHLIAFQRDLAAIAPAQQAAFIKVHLPDLLRQLGGSGGTAATSPQTAGIPQTPLTVPTTAQLPSYLQVPQGAVNLPPVPDWQKPFTTEQLSAFTNLNDANIGEQKRQMTNQLTSEALRRGYTGLPLGSMAGIDTQYNIAQANSLADLMRMQVARSDQLRNETSQQALTQENIAATRRGETAGNVGNLYNNLYAAMGQNPSSINMTPYANAAYNASQQYGNMANQYGNQAAQSGAGLAQLGSWMAWRNQANGGANNTPAGSQTSFMGIPAQTSYNAAGGGRAAPYLAGTPWSYGG